MISFLYDETFVVNVRSKVTFFLTSGNKTSPGIPGGCFIIFIYMDRLVLSTFYDYV